MKNKPPYALESVDNALRLLQMLRDTGRVRVTEAARELGCARSTAHRLLAMLVYRDFAVHDDERGYLPGPALSAPRAAGRPAQVLRQAMTPHMERLCDQVGETVNLVIRVGTQVRFLSSVESAQVLHVGDRRGTILPAHQASGGKALLAELTPEELDALYLTSEDGPSRDPMPPETYARLRRELTRVRRRGFALNLEETEAGVCAIGACVYAPPGHPVGALSIAVPSARFPRPNLDPLAAHLRTTARQALTDLTDLAALTEA
ncbi:MAG TPA: IclR family transcriptional regulator [Streptosporangiaceae bacterium]|jgi:DNA-binding IclR family transcriptional regulator